MKMQAIDSVCQFLEEDKIKYNRIDGDAVELYMQARNLTMHLLIYQHNGHLIFRVPAFIRNVELNRFDILKFLMKVMNEILDIRFELANDGKALSACCHHIVEDGLVTRAQFDLAMMIILHVVDDCYPQILHIIYSGGEKQPEFAPVPTNAPSLEKNVISSEKESDQADEADEGIDDEEKKGLKIN